MEDRGITEDRERKSEKKLKTESGRQRKSRRHKTEDKGNQKTENDR